MDNLVKLHLVSHTHWDREWYMPFEQFRYRLVGLLDRLLETLEQNPAYRFHLDGQAIILEDYLELRPERREQIRRFIATGQLAIGPWYVLMDEFLVSGEALIRNLEEGARVCAPLGDMQQLGYLPDLFGHIAQMPHILRQFGIERAIVWRGLNGTPEEAPTEFQWMSTAGEQVATVHLPYQYGYTSAMELPLDPPLAAERIRELAQIIGGHSRTGHVLLMNGFDHMEPQCNAVAIIQHWNETEAIPLVHTSIMDYMDESLAGQELPVQYGELRRTNHMPDGAINAILPGVLSSRIYLKQQNALAQTLLEKQVEPLQAMSAAILGKSDPDFVRLAWKYVLANHPHDSICGCSVDEVHDEMETRFMKAGQIGRQLIAETLNELGQQPAQDWLIGGEQPVIVVNTLPWERDGLIIFHLDTDDNALFRSVRVRDAAGCSYTAEIIGMERVCPIDAYSGRYPLSKPETNRYTVRVHAHSLPAFGYRLLAAQLCKHPRLDALPLAVPQRSIANAYVRLTVEPDGSLSWEDRESGQVWRGLHLFEEGGDVGDGYSYSQPLIDERLISGAAHSVSVDSGGGGETGAGWSSLTIRYKLEVPRAAAADGRSRSKERVELELVTVVTLVAGSRTASFRTELDNAARDHRVRLLFSLPKGEAPVAAGAPYDIIGRSERVRQPEPEAWFENEPTTFPFQQFVSVASAQGTAIVTADGLHEYEWIPEHCGGAGAGVGTVAGAAAEAGGVGIVAGAEAVAGAGTLAVTLLRSVSHMAGAERGRHTSSRPGPGLKAEGAQCLRKLSFAYSLTIHSPAADAAPWRIADEQSVAPLALALPLAKQAAGEPLSEAGAGAGSGAAASTEMAEVAEVAVEAKGEVAEAASASWLVVNAAEVQVTAIRPLQQPEQRGLEVRLVNLGTEAIAAEVQLSLPQPVASVAYGRVNGTELVPVELRSKQGGEQAGLQQAFTVPIAAKQMNTVFIRLEPEAAN